MIPCAELADKSVNSPWVATGPLKLTKVTDMVEKTGTKKRALPQEEGRRHDSIEGNCDGSPETVMKVYGAKDDSG